ncbi:gluconate:H+ symporter [Galbibacter sp.]|jgi:Gnt-I system high-affinity gluconate transporter|uniref:gluconate:H+ symporter n=1 Tax=Galbibacter sp. TaxID=2918471 RepID=UPI003A954DF5
MPLFIVLLGILLLFLLIVKFKLNAFLTFIIVSLFVGIAGGMELDSVVASIQNGIGGTLGFLVLILGLGAMLGKLVADSGAAQQITDKLIAKFGRKYIQWAVVLTGFIVGIPMFYSVGFVLLIPLIFTVAISSRVPLLYVGLPMLTSLSVTHGFLPPHPAPTAIVEQFNADIGKTLLYGIIIAIPTIIISGPMLARTSWIQKVNATPLKEFYNAQPIEKSKLPGMTVSILTALLPVILIGVSTIGNHFLDPNSIGSTLLSFVGDPVIAMLIAVLVGIYTLGLSRGKKMTELMNSLTESISSITMILLIIAGAGALKQILVDSGVSEYIADLIKDSDLSPLFLAWLIATVIRVCVGSATVAGLTTAGIVSTLAQSQGVSAELMVLAIGSGSLMLSHVNDSGFWMFKEYFNLSVKETLSTWTVMETSVGIIGLIGVLILNFFV